MNTKKPTPTTAAELLAEWIALQETEVSYGGLPHDHAFDAYDRDQQEIEDIAARLDEMCEDAGLYKHAGYLRMRTDHENVEREDEWKKTKVTFAIPTEELISMLQWLLIKESI